MSYSILHVLQHLTSCLTAFYIMSYSILHVLQHLTSCLTAFYTSYSILHHVLQHFTSCLTASQPTHNSQFTITCHIFSNNKTTKKLKYDFFPGTWILFPRTRFLYRNIFPFFFEHVFYTGTCLLYRNMFTLMEHVLFTETCFADRKACTKAISKSKTVP